MTTTTDTLRGALERCDRGVPDNSVGEHDAPISATGSPREDEDLRLMARVAAQDPQAMALLYRRYAPRLGRFLSKLLKSDALVHEAANDTMWVVWPKASQFDPDRARFSTWFFLPADRKHRGLSGKYGENADVPCPPTAGRALIASRVGRRTGVRVVRSRWYVGKSFRSY